MTIHSSLQQMLLERIEREGAITFAEYMRAALYEPGYGYYVTGAAKMGWEGDYFTSSDVSNLFAHCLGRQLQRMWEMLKQPQRFIVIEQGAGRGNLKQGVLQWARREAPELSQALEYREEDIRAGQDALHSGIEGEKASVFLSNELIDAFPVHIVQKHDGGLYEIYVIAQDGRLREALGEVSSPEVGNYLDRFDIPWQSFEDGWRAEINLDALHWMESVARRLRKGFVLAIDYGEKARDLYTRERREGTLLCYFQHSANTRPLWHPGEQDITAHVNFSALIHEGRRHGLRLHSYTTQREWLAKMGIAEELERMRARDFRDMDTQRASDQGQIALLQWYNLRQRAAALTDPYGMGNFKVLILRR
ncbi:MAG TPA: SAM-dependent methyltransferase [Ktedonobacteraceae bacterium]|nr:SAM-dependent methyltransferase [Ktedonobacteraceae bacterium]